MHSLVTAGIMLVCLAGNCAIGPVQCGKHVFS